MKKSGMLKVIIFLFAFFVGTAVAYSEKLELTVEEAVAVGLENSRGIKAKQLAVQSAKQGVRSAESSLYPNVSLSANYAHIFEPYKTTVGGTTYYTSPQDPIAVSTNLSQVITSFGKVKNEVRLAEMSVSGARLSLDEEKRALSISIRRAFYNYILAVEVLKVQEQALSYKEDVLATARERYEAGLVPDYEVLRAETDLESFRPNLMAAQKQVEFNLLAVVDLLGLKEDDKVSVVLIGTLEEEYPPLNKEDLVQKTLSNNYNLSQYRQSIALQKIQNDLKRKEKVPNVSGVASYSLSSGVDASTGEPLYWGKGSWDGYLSIGIQVDMPLSSLFPWSGEDAAIKQGKLDLEKLGYGLESLESSTKIALENLMITIEHQRSLIASNKKAVSLAQKLYSSAKERYSNGLITSLELQDNQAQLNDAQLGYLQAVYNYKAALFDLMDAVGVDTL